MAKAAAVQYACTECGYSAGRWLGKCPSCGEFGTLVEDVLSGPTVAKAPPKDAVRSPAATPAEVANAATPARTSTLATRSACLKRPAIAAPSRLVGATFPTNLLYWR